MEWLYFVIAAGIVAGFYFFDKKVMQKKEKETKEEYEKRMEGIKKGLEIAVYGADTVTEFTKLFDKDPDNTSQLEKIRDIVREGISGANETYGEIHDYYKTHEEIDPEEVKEMYTDHAVEITAALADKDPKVNLSSDDKDLIKKVVKAEYGLLKGAFSKN